MLCYLTGMKPYYITYIKDGPFQPKTAKDDMMESFISCETAKDTWTDLVYNFEGSSNTKENRIMDSKLEYNTFRAKPSQSLSQTYTRYKTLVNELPNDGVKLSKHEINVGFVNSLPEKWLRFSQEVSNDEDMVQVKVLMALIDDELVVGKNHARNGEWIGITMIKVNIILSMDEDVDWQTYLKCIKIDLRIWRKYILFGLNLGRNGTRLQLYSKTLKNWHTDCGDDITNPRDGIRIIKRRR
ncbi:hypothetical protein Tco_0500175 [Tanacetum coccineum]